MKNIYKNLLSIGLISIFLFSNLAIAQNCCPTACPADANCCPSQPACCPTPCEATPCCPAPLDCSCECQGQIEHLCTDKNSPVNLVKICGCNAIIERHTVLEATFAQKINSKKLCPGDNISFLLKNGLCTQEGRKILPNCSQIIACVECIQKPKAMNKPAKVSLNFKYVLTPCGKAYPIQARIYSTSGMLQESKLMGAGKVALYTVGLFGLGSGLGAAIGAGTGNATQAALTLGMPIGFGVGLLAGFLSPGLHFRAKCNEKVLIQLTDCLQTTAN